MDAEVNWLEYFTSIKKVCPWSLAYYSKNKIQIKSWDSNPGYLDGCVAIVYVHKHASARLLKKIADRMNSARPAEEWLFSHPKYKGHSTIVPVLIQQDHALLSRARSNLERK